MSQWERLKQLDSVCLQKVDELYSRDDFPMDVRDYLAQWIEDQDWEGASRDSSRAVVLFQILLENLDNQYSRFTQERCFLMQRNFKRFKQNFQRFQEDPCTLAEIISWFLRSEKRILEDAELAQEVSNYKFYELSAMLDSAESLLAKLTEDLDQWKRRQQISCIGAPEDTNLDPLEKWFTQVGDGMFQLRKFLLKLEELLDKLSYDEDPIKDQKPILQERVDTLLTTLIKSAFIVETQPSMPQGRGPLVLRTNVQFSVKASITANLCLCAYERYRRFNVLGTSSKALNMSESMNGGMVADFRHLLSLSVTEELHTIHFETQFEMHGLSVSLETTSLPVVVISNSSQQQSAWASVLWFNMLCPDPNNLLFFASSPVASWSQLGQMLSWQFIACAERGLNEDQLETLAQKLFGKQQSYDNCKISWTRFSKENISGQSFTLWVWLDGILNLVKVYLSQLWNDGSILGFVSKGKEKVLLKKKQGGTFLLRFSESCKDGGITFSWVEYTNDGEPNVRSVQPFTSVDLKQIPLAEILRNFQIMEAENAPVYPLQFLYPNTPKDQAFGKYYNEMTGGKLNLFLCKCVCMQM
uniref:Signal transducer and activator of transcription 1 n=1 Tax=Astyanax mexicanus TaxID=7994 RepID=A0A8B9RJ22_ASTMX